MEKRRLEKLGVDVSLLGLGMMRLPQKDGNIDFDHAKNMVKYAYDNGVNYFDTAWPYHGGKSEEFTGKALAQFDRLSFYVATKLPLWECKTKEDIYNVFNKQLENLGMDYIDFYLIHAVNKQRIEQIKELDVIEILEELREKGKIKYIGFSFHDDLDAFKVIADMYDWDFCQIQLNYMDTNHQQGIEGYEILTKKGIPVIIMEPLKGGKLASFNSEVEQRFLTYNKNKSIASWALRWIASFDNVKVVLSGMSNMEQLKENIDTYSANTRLNKEEMDIVDGVAKYLNSITKVNCTSCNYCMPCPHGVNIPANFRLINDYEMYKDTGHSKWVYSNLKNNSADASVCIACNECIEKCPQNIMIPDRLFEVDEEIGNL